MAFVSIIRPHCVFDFFQYNYNRERFDATQFRRTPVDVELSADLEAARPQTAGSWPTKAILSLPKQCLKGFAPLAALQWLICFHSFLFS